MGITRSTSAARSCIPTFSVSAWDNKRSLGFRFASSYQHRRRNCNLHRVVWWCIAATADLWLFGCAISWNYLSQRFSQLRCPPTLFRCDDDSKRWLRSQSQAGFACLLVGLQMGCSGGFFLTRSVLSNPGLNFVGSVWWVLQGIMHNRSPILIW